MLIIGIGVTQSTLGAEVNKGNTGYREDEPSISKSDQLLRHPTRLDIIARLNLVGTEDCVLLLRYTNLTWGNLSWHLGRLKATGYVAIEKKFLKDRPHTAVHITVKGRAAFQRCCRIMGRVPDVVVGCQRPENAGPESDTGESRTTHHRSKDKDVQASSPSLNEKIGIFRKSRIFADLEEEELAYLSNIAQDLHVKSGDFLFHAGDKAEYFCLVAAGRMKVLTHSPSGKDFINSFTSPGGMLGLSPLFSGKPHPSSAQASVDSVVLAIENVEFFSFVSLFPEASSSIFRKILHVIGTRHLDAVEQLADLAGERTDYRLAKVLAALSSEFGLMLPFTREEIAQMAGTTAETATRFVGRLSQKGVVRPARGKIIVLDQSRLGRLI